MVLKKTENNKCQCDKFIKANYKKSKIQIIKDFNEKFGITKGNLNSYLNKNIKLNDFYDIIIDIKSIEDINKGWEIKMSERAKKEYQNMIKKNVIRIGVLGNANKGKTFLLSKISKIDLPFGISTEGLCIKYSDKEEIYSGRAFVLLDSSGLDDIVLNNEDNEPKKSIKDKLRDKLIIKLFLQNYIINNSDILLIVFGTLTFPEQKLLNGIKIQLKNAKKNKRIFVVHNLKNFTRMKQVKDYIENVLYKNAFFQIEEGYKISTSTTKENGLYFVEKKMMSIIKAKLIII